MSKSCGFQELDPKGTGVLHADDVPSVLGTVMCIFQQQLSPNRYACHINMLQLDNERTFVIYLIHIKYMHSIYHMYICITFWYGDMR